jgi:glutathione S-transferase
MDIKLYALPGSHPCEAVEKALTLKGLAYERVDLLPGVSALLQLVRFGRRTVPSLRIDSYKVIGTPLILRTLDGIAPDPPLFPRDPGERAEVEELERWGDDEVQNHARWTLLYALTVRPDAGKSFLERANLPSFPDAVASVSTNLTFRAELASVGPGRAGAESWVRGIPQVLDHIDELIAAGTLGGDPPNAADLQIASSVALMMRLEDLRASIERRPAGQLAQRLFPDFPGNIPAGALPAEWVQAATASQQGAVTSAA